MGTALPGGATQPHGTWPRAPAPRGPASPSAACAATAPTAPAPQPPQPQLPTLPEITSWAACAAGTVRGGQPEGTAGGGLGATRAERGRHARVHRGGGAGTGPSAGTRQEQPLCAAPSHTGHSSGLHRGPAGSMCTLGLGKEPVRATRGDSEGWPGTQPHGTGTEQLPQVGRKPEGPLRRSRTRGRSRAGGDSAPSCSAVTRGHGGAGGRDGRTLLQFRGIYTAARPVSRSSVARADRGSKVRPCLRPVCRASPCRVGQGQHPVRQHRGPHRLCQAAPHGVTTPGGQAGQSRVVTEAGT